MKADGVLAKANKDFVILYVEDTALVADQWFQHICALCSPESKHVRSLGQGKKLLASSKRRFDLMIHDCNILFEDDQDCETPVAGARLYALAREKGIPVMVLTASPEIMAEDPYCSDPPLKVHDKLASREELERLVAECIQEISKGANR